MSLNFYNLKDSMMKSIFPDIYFTPDYGAACQFSDQGAVWECCIYKDLIYVYLKRPHYIEAVLYYDLITPYGYSGYYYQYQKTFDEFIKLFRQIALDKGYIVEIVRQNPYLDLKLSNYETVSSRPIFGIKIDDFDYYFNKVLNSKIRNIFRKAEKNGMNCSFSKLSAGCLDPDTEFRKLYQQTMDKVKSKPYYYFNDSYFKELEKLDGYLFKVINKDNKDIGFAIILSFDNFIHYHLSCNDNSSNCITEFLLICVVKEIGINKTFILGGGLQNGDSLHRFKSKLSNKEYNYKIYKNIINKEIYNLLT